MFNMNNSIFVLGLLASVSVVRASYGWGEEDHGGSTYEEKTKTVQIPIIKKYSIPIPHPVPVQVPQEIKIPVPQPYQVQVNIPQPYPVEVIKHIEIPVEKPEPYTVEKHGIHASVAGCISVDASHPLQGPCACVRRQADNRYATRYAGVYSLERVVYEVPFVVEKPYPVYVEKKFPVPVAKPYAVHVPVYKHVFHHTSSKGKGWH